MKRYLLLTLLLLALTGCAQTETGSTTANTPIQATPTLTPSHQLTPTPVPYYLENGSLFVLNQTNDEYLEVDLEVDEISMVDGVVTAKDSNGTELFVYFIGEVETWGKTDTKPLVLKSPLIMPDGRQVYGTFFNFDEGIWDIVPELAVANGMALVGDQAYGYDYETGDLHPVNLDGVTRYEMVDWVLTGFNAQGEVLVTYDNETMSWVNMEIRPTTDFEVYGDPEGIPVEMMEATNFDEVNWIYLNNGERHPLGLLPGFAEQFGLHEGSFLYISGILKGYIPWGDSSTYKLVIQIYNENDLSQPGVIITPIINTDETARYGVGVMNDEVEFNDAADYGANMDWFSGTGEEMINKMIGGIDSGRLVDSQIIVRIGTSAPKMSENWLQAFLRNSSKLVSWLNGEDDDGRLDPMELETDGWDFVYSTGEMYFSGEALEVFED